VWFEAIYPHHTRQVMRQSPTGAQLNMEIAAHTNFSLAVAMMGAGGKRAGDDVRRVSAWQWIGGPIAVGATTTSRDSGCDVWDLGKTQPPQAPGKATHVAPTQPSLRQRLTISLPPIPSPSETALASGMIPAFHLRTGDPELDRQTHEFATVFMMPRGGVYGNSAYSISCLHELSLLPQILGVFGGEKLGGFGDESQMHTSANEVMATQLRLYAETALHDANAYLYMRYAVVPHTRTSYAVMPILTPASLSLFLLSLSLSIYLSLCLSVCLSIDRSIDRSICLSICLSGTTGEASRTTQFVTRCLTSCSPSGAFSSEKKVSVSCHSSYSQSITTLVAP
jgi:hypothetical protein